MGNVCAGLRRVCAETSVFPPPPRTPSTVQNWSFFSEYFSVLHFKVASSADSEAYRRSSKLRASPAQITTFVTPPIFHSETFFQGVITSYHCHVGDNNTVDMRGTLLPSPARLLLACFGGVGPQFTRIYVQALLKKCKQERMVGCMNGFAGH